MRFAILARLVGVGLLATSVGAGDAFEPIAVLDHEPLDEVSGITRSSYPGIFWVHNDSGDKPRIFAVTLDGQPVIPSHLEQRYATKVWPGLKVLNASNVDWEDITIDDGTLYIADTGNNGNARRDLGVYVLAEPNPHAVDRARSVRFLPVRYPDQHSYPAREWQFDCEALFVADGELHFLTKHRLAGQIVGLIPGTKLYRLDNPSALEDNVLTLVGERPDMMMPTAAEISPDGQRLAVLTYMAVWVFERPDAGRNWLAGRASRFPLDRGRAASNEAITWADQETLIVANEERRLFRLKVSALTRVEP
jgi:hypothetical protein